MTEITIQTSDLMSVQDFAEKAGRHRWQVYRWIKKGRIRAVRLGGILFIPTEEMAVVKTFASLKRDRDAGATTTSPEESKG